MRKRSSTKGEAALGASGDRLRTDEELFPDPSPGFRRRAWLEFQRALDPLAPPKPLRLHRRG